MAYPFQPKSTAKLRPGQFWPIPLPHGGFACGMVLDVVRNSTRHFLAGLIDWHGPQEPTPTGIAGRPLIIQGTGHLKMIQNGHGWITGILPDHVAPPAPLLWTSPLANNARGLYRGLDLISQITPEQAAAYPQWHGWGYNVINLLAAKHFPPSAPPSPGPL